LISKINNQDLAHHAILNNQIFLPETNDAEVIWETTQTLQYKNYRIISFYHTEGEKTNQYLEVYKNENLIFKDLIHLDIQKLSFDTFYFMA
jgi:hypothetical protein